MLKIQTTGFQDFLDGSANIKVMIIGGPDAGKTRSASYWPRPFYLDCENSRGSLRDRQMPYVEIATSNDMLDALEYLKGLEVNPKSERLYQTIVVDTVDSFQRKVKDEWIRDNNAGVFSGYDAWGYLDTKMQILLTRLLNLDYNVICNIHWVRERADDDGQRQYALQLEGKIQHQIFNDFALIGRLGSYWEHDASKGEKVEKRGLTFKKNHEWPFLKDRFNLFAERWLPITFSDEDYCQLSRAFAVSADSVSMPDAEEVGEIPTANVTFTRDVVPPGPGGPVGPQLSKEQGLNALTKLELIDRAKKLGIEPKTNWVKAELVEAIDARQKREERKAADNAETVPIAEGLHKRPQTSDAASASANGQVDEFQEAADLLSRELDATVLEGVEKEPPEKKALPTIGGRPVDKCDDCSKDLAGEKFSFVQLSWFKHRKLQCYSCYEQALKASRR